MKTENVKDISYYEGLPYTITIRKDDDGDFVARIQELPGCVAHGDTEAAAIEILRSVQRLWIEEALAAGNPVPEPEGDTDLPSGKWVQRVPRRLHRDLVALAKRDNVSLNLLVTSMLSEALSAKSCAQTIEVFLSGAIAHISGAPMNNYLLWAEPPHEMNQWSTSSHQKVGNLTKKLDWVAHSIKGLAAVKSLEASPFFDPYAEEYTESHRLARK